MPNFLKGIKLVCFAIWGLCLLGCSSDSPDETVSLSTKELAKYTSKIVRFSNSVKNPCNWGASPEDMDVWARKVGWEMSSPMAQNEDNTDLYNVTYWLGKGEGDFKQMIILSFRESKLQYIDLMVLEKMDAAIKIRHDIECASIKKNTWRCESANTVVKRRTFGDDIGVMYTFGEGSEIESIEE